MAERIPPETYRWIIVLGGTLGLLGALGLGRFSLGIMLPAMGEGLHLSYGQMGVISTANFCGYLAAVLCCGWINRLLGARRLIFLGLLLIGGSMTLIGWSSSFAEVLILYSLTGIGSALANIPIMALIAVWFTPGLRGRAAGLCVAGNGAGIFLSGKAVPVLNQLGHGWQLSWMVIGGIVSTIALVCLALIRNHPGTGPFPAPGKAAEALQNARRSRPAIYHLCGALYFLFGFTYVIYVTFIVTSMIQDRGYSEQAAGTLWAWCGLLAVISGPLFGYISDRIGRKKGLMIVFSIQALAYLTAAWLSLPASIYFSLFTFSLVAFSVPTVMAALVGDLAGPERAASMFGYVTFIFGFGQITGPSLAGVAAEYSGSFAASFLMAALLAAGAVVLSVFLPDRVSEHVHD